MTKTARVISDTDGRVVKLVVTIIVYIKDNK